ncbi:hypothetical protein D9M68_359270 [compost metagenome]
MDDRAERCNRTQLLEETLGRRRVGDVTGVYRCRHAGLRPGLDHRRRFGIRLTAARAERNLRRAFFDEPVGSSQTETADAADDEMHAVRIDLHAAMRTLGNAMLTSNRRQHDDLADMARILHQPERVADLVEVEGTVGKRRELAVFEQRADLGEDPLGKLRLVDQQLVGVDAEIADIAAEGPETNLAVGIVVAFAELEEATEGLHECQALFHGFGKERIQNEIDTLSVRYGANVVDETERTGIEDVIGTQHRQEAALLARACRGDDLGTLQFRDLQRGKADAAGSAVDEDRFVRLDAAEFHHGVIGGQEGDRHRCRGNRADSLRQPGDAGA